jgi:hypothetical protein
MSRNKRMLLLFALLIAVGGWIGSCGADIMNSTPH